MTQAAFESDPQLIVYGGSFDPPHQGHVECVSMLCRNFPNAMIMVVPSPETPIAGGGVKSHVATFAHRLEMCRDAVATLDHQDRVVVSDMESSLPTPHYTVHLLEALAKQYPKRRLAFVMGQDQWNAFPKWKDPEGILKLAEVIVVNRAGESSDALIGTPSPFEKRVHFLRAELSPASSTAIRDALNRGKEPPRGWLPPPVSHFIARHGLYGY